MGASNSKLEKDEALRLCKARMRFIKQAIDSRYALSAAHLAYVQSLRNVGSDLRRFAEAEISNDLSMSTSEPEKSPSHSSYASPSPSQLVENLSSPMRNSSPISPRLSNISYMRSGGSIAMTVKMDSSSSHFVDDGDSLTFPLPPPPLPPLDVTSTWDFFDTSSSKENVANGHSREAQQPSSNGGDVRKSRENGVARHDEEDSKWVKVHPLEHRSSLGFSEIQEQPSAGAVKSDSRPCENFTRESITNVPASENVQGKPALNHQTANANGCKRFADVDSSNQRCPKFEKKEQEKVGAEREDASEFITHRAKDFLSSVKDIEHRFIRAAEYGSELSRMLEAKKIRLNGSLEKAGRSSPSFLAAIQPTCCLRSSALDHDTTHNMNKVITWNRSLSSVSSSSRHPLTSTNKDDCDSSSDFVEEFCMISGSHSSTLDRLYAWERKLYDEVKSSEAIRKEYDRKCFQLRSQFARDMNAQVIDKTRSIVKDLHSQVRVAIEAVDSISRRIEKLRDEELLPQVVELIQGFIRMWKAMLACHHAQYITISLAYQVKSVTMVPRGESYRQVLVHLQNEMGCFASSLEMWVEAHGAYVESLNGWLHNCILQPQERSRGRKAAFSPRRAIAPPIFVLCRDWSVGIKSLPSEEFACSIKEVMLELQNFTPVIENKRSEPHSKGVPNGGEERGKKENECISSFDGLQAALMKMFDCLTKFAEASLKMCEEVKNSSEAARNVYANRRVRFIT